MVLMTAQGWMKPWHQVVGLLAALTLTAGCETGFVIGNAPPAPVDAAAAAPAGAGFDQLLTYAMTTAPDVRRARAELAAAKAALDTAKGALGPGLTGRGESFQLGELQSSATIEVRQPIWHGGRNRLNVARAQVQADLSGHQLRATQDISGHKLIDLYFQWLTADTEVQIRQKHLKQSQAVLDDIRAEFENGLVGGSEYTSAQIEVDQMQRRLLTVDAARENARVALESFLQAPQDEAALRRGAPKTAARAPKMALGKMVDGSPHVAAALKRVDLAHLDVELHKAGQLPSMDAVARREWTEGGIVGNGVGLTVELSVQNPKTTKARMVELKNTFAATQAAVDTTKTDLQTRILQANRSLDSSRARIETLTNILRRAEDALQSAQRQKAAGTGAWETVIASINELAELRVSLSEAQNNKTAALNHLALYAKGAKS